MSQTKNQKKSDFLKLIMSDLEFTSCDKEEVARYMEEEGLDRDSIIKEGMKGIKQIRLHAQAMKTQREMNSTQYIKDKALKWVEGLLNNVNFSFPEFAKSHELVLHNRNIEAFTEEDIKNTLTSYFYLKFTDNEGKNVNE
ncbi:hypothetical protein ACFSUS_28600 [Spirosoma soli]|uniref:Uncharacterized protein n=1 Tax=Spirosoma soli TaxID=1770529 RepID=A0ABW5MEV0_9BACT